MYRRIGGKEMERWNERGRKRRELAEERGTERRENYRIDIKL